MLDERDGVVTESSKRVKSSTLAVPMCVLEKDDKNSLYKVRFDDGTIALVKRKYVLKSTDKPPITVNCDDDTPVVSGKPGIIRGIGENPCK